MNEIRVNIGGAEMELRPVSARQYLAARMETEKMTDEFGSDQISQAILFGASLLSKCLFYDNKRIFSDGAEVLDALSADEIVNTAEYIDIEPERKVMIVKTVERVRQAGQETADYETMIVKNEEAEAIERIVAHEQNTSSNEYVEHYEVKNVSDRRRSASPRSDMRKVSDFFQRDSRRYDDIITSY